MKSYDFTHPKGTKYSEKELRAHRDSWFAKVAAGGQAQVDAARIARDKRVYEAFITAIPYDPTIVYFKHRSFEAAFPLSVLEPLNRYEYYRDDPANEFADPDLESLRGAFLAACDELLNLLSANTWSLPNKPGFNAIPEEWERINLDRLKDVLKQLNNAYATFSQSYSALTRECQIRLGA